MAQKSSDTLPTCIEYHSTDLYYTYTMYNLADVRWDILNNIMSSYYLRYYRIFGLNGLYDTYSPFEYAQPHTDPIFVHPTSVATQLRLTQEEIREVLEDQERWMREEYMVEEQGMHAPTTTTQYQQVLNIPFFFHTCR